MKTFRELRFLYEAKKANNSDWEDADPGCKECHRNAEGELHSHCNSCIRRIAKEKKAYKQQKKTHRLH